MKTMHVSDVNASGKQTVVFKLEHAGDRLLAIAWFNKRFVGSHWMSFNANFVSGKGTRRV